MIVDASAIIAYLKSERGGDAVEPLLPTLTLPIVNLAEVQKAMLASAGSEPDAVTSGLVDAGVTLIVSDTEHAAIASRYTLLKTPKGHRSLSLADGFCIAHAERLQVSLLTADRVWAELSLRVPVELIR